MATGTAKDFYNCFLCHGTIRPGQQMTWTSYGDDKGRKAHQTCFNQPRTITAKFASRCRVCRKVILVGQKCELNSSKPTGLKIRCLDCVAAGKDITITDENEKPTPAPKIEDVPLPDTDTDTDTNDTDTDTVDADEDTDDAEESNPSIDTDADTDKIMEQIEDIQPFKMHHYHYAKLKRNCIARIHTWLHGEAGSGKSHSAMLIAEELNLPFYFVALTPQTPVTTLSGYMDGFGKYVPTVIYEWVKNGGVLLLDEVDNSFNPTVIWFNNGLASGKFVFPNSPVPVDKHPNSIVIAAANTPGLGPTPMYMDRRPVDESVRSRFVFLEWNTDGDLEKQIAASIATPKTQAKCKAWTDYVQKSRAWVKANMPALLVTQRATILGCQLINAGETNAKDLVHEVILRGQSKEVCDKFLANNPIHNIWGSY